MYFADIIGHRMSDGWFHREFENLWIYAPFIDFRDSQGMFYGEGEPYPHPSNLEEVTLSAWRNR